MSTWLNSLVSKVSLGRNTHPDRCDKDNTPFGFHFSLSHGCKSANSFLYLFILTHYSWSVSFSGCCFLVLQKRNIVDYIICQGLLRVSRNVSASCNNMIMNSILNYSVVASPVVHSPVLICVMLVEESSYHRCNIGT